MGAKALLFGALGREYADLETFTQAGIAPLFQEYQHPTYWQLGRRPFDANMSAVDLLFNHGPKSKTMLTADNITREGYLRQADVMLNKSTQRVQGGRT